MPNGKCRMHGGKSLSGIAHPNFKMGRYSKSGPLALRARIAEAEQDEDTLNSTPSINLLDARIAELLDKLPDDEEARKAARSLLAHLSEARTQHAKANDEKRKPEEREEARMAFFSALEHAWLYQAEVSEYALLQSDTWSEVYSVLNQRRTQVDTEIKRITAAAETMAEDKARVMFGHILHVVRQNITDRATLQRIQQAVRELAS
jgi:hypothetical protein